MRSRQEFLLQITECIGQYDDPAAWEACDDHPEMVTKAMEIYASWGKALRRAGLEPEFSVSPLKTRLQGEARQILASLIGWIKVHGPLCTSAVRATDEALFKGVCKHFGSVEAVASRFKLPTITDPEMNMVECAICGYRTHSLHPHLRHTHQITSDEYRAQYPNQPLRSVTARSRSRSRNKIYNQEEILEKLREYAKTISPLSYYRIAEVDRSFVDQASNLFGTWRNAVDAAGLEKVNRKRRTKEDIVTEIQNYADSLPQEEWHERLCYGSMKRTHLSLVAAALRQFGGWREALDAAGIDSRLIMKTRWTRELVIKELRKYAGEFGAVSSKKLAVSRSDLYSAVKKFFGQIEDAATELNLPYERKLQRWTLEKAEAMLKEWCEEHGALNIAALKEYDSSLEAHVRRKMGSLEKAAKKFGLPYQALHKKKWTIELVKEELKNLHEKGVELRVCEVNRHGPQGLVKATRRFFGTWKNALFALELPLPTRGQPTPPVQLKEEVLQWMKEHGRFQAARMKKTNESLCYRIRKRYGTFELAAKALNVPYSRKRK